jgi:DNA polymerase III sliding clamp (beta) subunit (PCNA family)
MSEKTETKMVKIPKDALRLHKICSDILYYKFPLLVRFGDNLLQVVATDRRRLVIFEQGYGATYSHKFTISQEDAAKLEKSTKEESVDVQIGEEAESFPNFESVMPKQDPVIMFDVDVDLLVSLLEVFKKFCPKNDLKVRFYVYSSVSPVKIKAEKDDKRLIGLIMPCVMQSQ